MSDARDEQETAGRYGDDAKEEAPRERERERADPPRTDDDEYAGRGGGGERRQREEPGEGCKLFVGGLSFQTDKELIETEFGRFGEVSDVYLPTAPDTGRPRGFGFVTYTKEGDAAAAVEEMNG